MFTIEPAEHLRPATGLRPIADFDNEPVENPSADEIANAESIAEVRDNILLLPKNEIQTIGLAIYYFERKTRKLNRVTSRVAVPGPFENSILQGNLPMRVQAHGSPGPTKWIYSTNLR